MERTSDRHRRSSNRLLIRFTRTLQQQKAAPGRLCCFRLLPSTVLHVERLVLVQPQTPQCSLW